MAADDAQAGCRSHPTHTYYYPAPQPQPAFREPGVYSEPARPFVYHAPSGGSIQPSHYYHPPSTDSKATDSKAENYCEVGVRAAEISNSGSLSRTKSQEFSRDEDVRANSPIKEQAFKPRDQVLPGPQSGRNIKEEERHATLKALRHLPDYSQGHSQYTTQPAYYPPLHPGYGPPDTWHVPYPTYVPYYHGNNTYHNALQYASSTPYPPPIRPKKRQWSSLSPKSPSGNAAPEERLFNRKSDKTSLCTCPTAKPVRRKKKMYSDFVGVTYNKTHAKYQSCITHYRKQHYLGRYKLAVDAALAYDECAKLLKGLSWKVNFSCRQAYEAAKLKELEIIGKVAGTTVDFACSLEQVALKVGEIASNVGRSRAPPMVSSVYGMTSGHRPLVTSHAWRMKKKCPVGRYGQKIELALPILATATLVPATKAKVTPSPTLQTSSLFEQKELLKIIGENKHLETPLPASPNPIRHAMGTEKRTPDSVIRPKNLTYKGGEEGHSKSLSHNPQLIIEGDANQQQVEQPHQSQALSVEKVQIPHSPLRLELGGKNTPTTKLTNVILSLKPPLIQNGTLAAASALMTLFDVEKNESDI